jgi:hypothetical protein
VETATAIRQTFETVIMCDLYPRSQIDIFITILQADGGEQHVFSPPAPSKHHAQGNKVRVLMLQRLRSWMRVLL